MTELNHEKAVLDERTHELQVLEYSGLSLLALLALLVQNYKYCGSSTKKAVPDERTHELQARTQYSAYLLS